MPCHKWCCIGHKRVASKVDVPKSLPAGHAVAAIALVFVAALELLSDEERRSWRFRPENICHGSYNQRHGCHGLCGVMAAGLRYARCS